MFGRWNEIMFEDIGTKIKKVAVVSVWIGIISSLIGAVCMFVTGLSAFEDFWWMILLSPIIFFCGCVISWLSVIFIYGFGELICDTKNINRSIKNLKITSDTSSTVEHKHGTFENVTTYSREQAKRETEIRSKVEVSENKRSSLKTQNQVRQSQVYDVWMSPGSKADEEKEKIEENSTPRQKLKNKIAELSVKRNLINPDDTEAKAKLTREIDALKAELAALTED